MSQENVEIVRLAYAAFSERNLDALAELTDPNWVFDFSRSIGLEKGVYRGYEQWFDSQPPVWRRSRDSSSRRSTTWSGLAARSSCGIRSAQKAEAAAWNGNEFRTRLSSGKSATAR